MERVNRGLYLAELAPQKAVWDALDDYVKEKRLQYLEEVCVNEGPAADRARGKVMLATTLMDDLTSEIEWALAENANKPDDKE